MKYFVILLLLAGFVFSSAFAQYQGDVEFYHLSVEIDSKQYSILSQSITNKFIGVFYDDKAGSLIFSISKSADLIDSAAITMNQHSLSELFSSGKTQDPNNMLVLINGEEQPRKTVKDNNVVSWVFQIPPNSDEIELIPSSERFGVGNYRLEDVPNSLPKAYSPLKQEHIGIPYNEIQCNDGLVQVFKKADNSTACVTEQTKQKLVERGWIKNDDHPFGTMGPMMSQENCNGYVISQWQPTFEGREMAQQFLEICIQRGFATPELVERGKIADNFTYGPIQTAKRSAEGDIEKTIENLEEMYREKTIENLEEAHRESDTKSVVHVDVDKEEYHTDDVIIISGYVEGIVPNAELNITVRNPLMDVVLVSQVTISEDGAFAESLPIDGPLWKQNGIYLVSVYYNKATDHTDFLYLSDLESDDLL